MSQWHSAHRVQEEGIIAVLAVSRVHVLHASPTICGLQERSTPLILDMDIQMLTGIEGGGGKIRLLEAGAYKDQGVDVSLIAHPGIGTDAALVRTAAYVTLKVEYFGKEAHAAARPWDGVRGSPTVVCIES